MIAAPASCHRVAAGGVMARPASLAHADSPDWTRAATTSGSVWRSPAVSVAVTHLRTTRPRGRRASRPAPDTDALPRVAVARRAIAATVDRARRGIDAQEGIAIGP